MIFSNDFEGFGEEVVPRLGIRVELPVGLVQDLENDVIAGTGEAFRYLFPHREEPWGFGFDVGMQFVVVVHVDDDH